MKLFTLGRLALLDGAETLLAGRRKLLALLAYLARQSGRPVSRCQLISLFWSDVDETRGRRSLRTAITELRAAVPAVVAGDDDDLRLMPGSVELDTSAFEAEVTQGR